MIYNLNDDKETDKHIHIYTEDTNNIYKGSGSETFLKKENQYNTKRQAVGWRTIAEIELIKVISCILT